MPVSLRSLAAVAAAALALAACDPRFVSATDLKPSEIQTLTGVYQGEGTLSFSIKNDCPRVFLWTMRVGGGNVDGELVNKITPNATPTRFTTFLDYDASLHVAVRPENRGLDVLGTFKRASFSGTARSTECNYVIRLQRVDTRS